MYRLTWKIRLWHRMWQNIRELNQRVYDQDEKIRDLQAILMTKKKWK